MEALTLSSSCYGEPFLRRLLRALLLALAAATGSLAVAQTEPAVAWAHGDIAAQYWADASGKASLDGARSAFDAGQGRPADPTQLMPLGGGAAVWYRLQLPSVMAPARAMFEVMFPGTDSVVLFRPDGAGGWSQQRAGDSLPVSEWPVHYLHPAFAFTLQPGETQATYLRIQHTYPIRVNWVLQDTRSFNSVSKVWHLALGAYAGFMLLVVLLSAVNTYTWRDPIHLYYAGHVILVGLSVMSLTGLGGEYLWPDNAWWNDKAPSVLPTASIGWAAVFVRQLVAERGRRLMSWSLLALAAVSFMSMIAFMVVARENFYRVPSVFTVPGMALILAVLAWYARRRPEVGLWVLVGMALLAAGTMLPVLRNLGWLPFSFVTQYGMQLGAALEIPLVLIGLYFRSRERRDNLLRIGALAHTDPLTGVGNHRVLVACLQDLLERSRRSPFRGAVLQVHLANLDAIRSEYGREAAEAALVQAAECVTKEARESDTVAREQGGDLVLVLEGQVTRGQAAEAGRNIIARGLKFSGRLPPRVTLSLRVAGAYAPLPETNAAVFLGMLGRVILEIGTDPLGRALRFIGQNDEAPARRGPRASLAADDGQS
jgi:diguanylate cyclase (GGDEF)-like protein